MSGSGQVLHKVAGGAVVSAPAWLAGLGVRDLAGALAVAVIVVAALCWVLADEDRSRRLTGIVGAWRGTRPRPVGLPAGKATRGRRGRVAAGSGPPALPGGGAAGTG